jgi:hypothetical protein
MGALIFLRLGDRILGARNILEGRRRTGTEKSSSGNIVHSVQACYINIYRVPL